MPRRKEVLATNEIYHLFNRSVGNEEIFTSRWFLHRALELLDYYRFPQTIRYSQFKALPIKEKNDYLTQKPSKSPLVEIYSFALMPNHYHILLKQLREKGISTFAANFQNSFAKYYNLKNNRHGTLFENPFKAKWIETNEEFLHISRYIHLNPVTSFIIKFPELKNYPWTSFYHYAQNKEKGFVKKEMITKMFRSPKEYLDFVADEVDYQRRFRLIKRLTME